jgi:release factor glutamine methyltransferase
MGLEFKVTPCVFIPRPETELLVEKVIELVTRVQGYKGASLKILDIGTGSGCIAVSLAKLVPQAKIDAVDISEQALKIAKENARLNKIKVNFFQSDLFTTYDLPCLPAGRRLTTYDIIVSNPPYVVASEINNLQAEVRQEPRLALDGGRDGLDFYRRIIVTAWRYLRKGGLLVLEIGFGQKEEIKNIFQKSAKFEIIEITKDYNNIDRVVVAKLKQDVRKNG